MICKISTLTVGTTEDQRIIHLPKLESELNALLCDMGINRDNGFYYSVTHIKTGNDSLDEYLSENPATIDELNHIAEYISGFDNKELEQLGNILEIEKPDNTVGLINIMHNHEGYTIYENIPDMAELGKEMALRLYDFDEDSPIGMCVNYEQFGEGFHSAHQGMFQNDKYIISPSSPAEVYDGMMIPGTDRLSEGKLLAVKVTAQDDYELFNHGIVEKDDMGSVWVQLPTTKYSLDRTAHRLGADTLDDCIIVGSNSHIDLLSEPPVFDRTESLYKINTLCEVLHSYKTAAQMEKFEAVLMYENFDVSYSDIINIAANLECYDHKPEIRCVEDLVIDKYDGDLVKMAHADYPSGEELLLQNSGKITDYGFVARNSKSMEQIYKPPEQTQFQGMDMQM